MVEVVGIVGVVGVYRKSQIRLGCGGLGWQMWNGVTCTLMLTHTRAEGGKRVASRTAAPHDACASPLSPPRPRDAMYNSHVRCDAWHCMAQHAAAWINAWITP